MTLEKEGQRLEPGTEPDVENHLDAEGKQDITANHRAVTDGGQKRTDGGQAQGPVDEGRRGVLKAAAIAGLGGLGYFAATRDSQQEIETQENDESAGITTETEQPTETETETETEEPDPNLHFEEIYQETFDQNDEPLIGGNNIRTEDTTLKEELVEVSNKMEDQIMYSEIDGEEIEEVGDAEGVLKETIHNQLGYSMDELMIINRKDLQGFSKYRIIDNTGEEEKRHILDFGDGEAGILMEGEKATNHSQQQAIKKFRDGKFNPLAIERQRAMIEELGEPPMSDSFAREMSRRNDEAFIVFDKKVRAPDVDLTFAYDIGGDVSDLAKDMDFVRAGTEYRHNVAFDTESKKMVIDIVEDKEEVDPAYNNIESLMEYKGGEVIAATVDNETYKEMAVELYKPESWKDE